TSLEELARTASFLGNARVRILDGEGQVLADSGRASHRDQALWIVSVPVRGTPSPFDGLPGPLIIVPAADSHLDEPASADRILNDLELQGIVPVTFELSEDLLRELPTGAEFLVAERRVSPWGTRFVFGSLVQAEQIADMLGNQTGGREAEPVAFSVEDVPSDPDRVVSVPIGDETDTLGSAELSKSPDAVAEAVATARRALLLAGGGTTLLAVLVGLLVSGRLTQPLKKLTAATAEMSGGDLSVRAPVHRDDEIGQLARQFNRMAERLEASFSELAAERDTLRRFIADASHELRTPITALRNFNELLQGAAADDPDARQEFLAESETQLGRLGWITDNLLDLSRIEAGLVSLDLSEHDARDLVAATASAFRPQALDRGLTLATEVPATPLQLRCDRHRIELALSNLLDNALKFTRPGRRVEIGAQLVGQKARFWVADDGQGIPPEDLPHVFERFYRGRGQDQSAVEGSGLGLAIVRSIAEAHGGRVLAESRLGYGSRITLELPLNPQQATAATPPLGP
ncbi:MAG: HAMP domain-containing sensor histidine kinase, partial [Anaerolineae bacterium]